MTKFEFYAYAKICVRGNLEADTDAAAREDVIEMLNTQHPEVQLVYDANRLGPGFSSKLNAEVDEWDYANIYILED